jgi:hypothetical protein
VLKDDGPIVRGYYYYESSEGPQYGHMEGNIEGNRLNYSWWQGPSKDLAYKDLAYKDAKYRGDGYMVLSEMGKKLEGKWRAAGSAEWAGDWVAARTK